MRTATSIQVENTTQYKENLLSWAQQFDVFTWIDSNDYHQKYTTYDAVLAVETNTFLTCDCKHAFEKLKEYQSEVKDYIFGYLAYDLKNDLENLSSNNRDGLGFSELFFFQPKKIFFLKGNKLEVKYVNAFENEIQGDLEQIKKITHPVSSGTDPNKIQIKQRTSKDAYDKKLTDILNHIHRGDIYEVNFCQEFYAENTTIDPLKVYQKLNHISSPPFATFFKIRDKFLLSASPERFVKKEGEKIISQPIKGTARRSQNQEEDLNIAKQLFKDPKERSENIMIVDLVRNDLSKTAIKGSVAVEELCKVYSFKQVHQLISTVVSKVAKDTNPVAIIKSLFPMGSMTGAPKISAMEIIEVQEDSKRGLYSGAVGYFTPNNNFDFNVIIRSILYNQSQKYVSFTVGGAITSKSIIDNEYEECLIKAAAMKKALHDH